MIFFFFFLIILTSWLNINDPLLTEPKKLNLPLISTSDLHSILFQLIFFSIKIFNFYWRRWSVQRHCDFSREIALNVRVAVYVYFWWWINDAFLLWHAYFLASFLHDKNIRLRFRDDVKYLYVIMCSGGGGILKIMREACPKSHQQLTFHILYHLCSCD